MQDQKVSLKKEIQRLDTQAASQGRLEEGGPRSLPKEEGPQDLPKQGGPQDPLKREGHKTSLNREASLTRHGHKA